MPDIRGILPFFITVPYLDIIYKLYLRTQKQFMLRRKIDM